MKNLLYPIITLLVMGIISAGAGADSIYTWTDAKGQTHITQEPPPPGAKLKDTIDYVPKAPEAEDFGKSPEYFETTTPRTAPSLRGTGDVKESDERKVIYDGDGGRYTRRAIGSELKDKDKARPTPVKKRHRSRR